MSMWYVMDGEFSLFDDPQVLVYDCVIIDGADEMIA